MTQDPRWITKSVILAVHERLLAEHGGGTGIIDEGRLDAALESPKNHLAHANADIFELAAALAHALTRNHPFRDGNKRVAMTAAGVFLMLNAFRLEATEPDAVQATIALSTGALDLSGFAAWLRSSSVPAPEASKPRRPQR